MKLFDIDWTDFYRRLGVWDRLALRTRRTLGRLKANKGVNVSEFGDDLSRLAKAKFVSVYVDGDRAKLHKDCYPFARVIRAMSRHEILEWPSAELLENYITDHFNHAEQEALSQDTRSYRYNRGGLVRGVMSVRWLQDFLSLENLKQAQEWETARHRGSYYYSNSSDCSILKSAKALSAAQSIIGELMSSTASVSFSELKSRFEHLSPSILADATCAGIRYLMLFPSMRQADMTPMINVWPTITQRLHRPKVKPPKSVTPDETFHYAYLMEDMTTVLVSASGEPPRVRSSDHALFTKAKQQLESSLLTLPEWLVKVVECTPGRRVGDAVEFLQEAELVNTQGVQGKDLRLEPTAKARDWLGMSSKDRLKSIFDRLTADRTPKPKPLQIVGGVASDEDRDEDLIRHVRNMFRLTELADEYEDDDDDYDEYDEYVTPYRSSYHKREGFLPRTVGWECDKVPGLDVPASVIEAYGSQSRRRFVPLFLFADYHAQQVNPILNLSGGTKSPKLRIEWSWREPTDEEAEYFWGQLLIDFFCYRLLPLGCVEVGLLSATEELCFTLTDAGRFFLGLKKDFDYGHRSDQQSHIVVQPNFEVVFLSPAPLAEATISRFAQRMGHGKGTLFRITKKSIFAAAAQNLTAEHVLGTLRDASAKAIPTNVVSEIQEWFGQCERVAMKTVVVIRCPDAQTASRVLAAGGRKVASISDTVLELSDREFQTQFVKKLKETGVFVDSSPQTPRKTSKRRRRSW